VPAPIPCIPVVSISQNGLSESVVKEINASLASHELIKIRVYNDDRERANSFSPRFASNWMRHRYSISENCW
jgi:RNA-binding protein YhbY